MSIDTRTLGGRWGTAGAVRIVTPRITPPSGTVATGTRHATRGTRRVGTTPQEGIRSTTPRKHSGMSEASGQWEGGIPTSARHDDRNKATSPTTAATTPTCTDTKEYVRWRNARIANTIGADASQIWTHFERIWCRTTNLCSREFWRGGAESNGNCGPQRARWIWRLSNRLWEIDTPIAGSHSQHHNRIESNDGHVRQ